MADRWKIDKISRSEDRCSDCIMSISSQGWHACFSGSPTNRDFNRTPLQQTDEYGNIDSFDMNKNQQKKTSMLWKRNAPDKCVTLFSLFDPKKTTLDTTLFRSFYKTVDKNNYFFFSFYGLFTFDRSKFNIICLWPQSSMVVSACVYYEI